MDQSSRLIEVLSEPTILLTAEGRLLAVNRAARGLLEQPSDEKKFFQDYLASSREDFLTFLRTCSRNAQPVLGSLALTSEEGVLAFNAKGAVLEPRKPDSPAVILLQFFPKIEANKRFVLLKDRIGELNEEIVKRQRSEYELRAQKEWLQVTLSSIGDAVVVADANCLVAFLNPVAERLTGWNRDDALGKELGAIFSVIDETTRRPVENPVRSVLESKQVVSLASNSLLLTKDGREVPIADTAAPILVEGRLEGVILVFHDVTEKRTLLNQLMERAEKLETANRRMNEFLVMLAHELRSPLAPISNAVQLLAFHEARPELTTKAQDILARQVDHLTRITDDLLDVSRIVRGKVQLVKDKLDLARLVTIVCEDRKAEFVQADLDFVVEVPKHPLWVEGDSTRLTQVVGNLLNNANKFTPPNGMVKVSLSEKSGNAILMVSDTGQGIETYMMSHVFEPFTQSEQSLARSNGGLGLGLSIIKGIVDLHEGEVIAESPGKGKGARFTVMLPLSRAMQVEEREAARRMAGTGYKVLIIEDNHDTAESLGLLLGCLGHQVQVAHDGNEGLELARTTKPDVIVCDIGLPGLDGFTVAKKLRESPDGASVLLIALTGYGDKSFEDKARQAGFDHHMTKPVKIDVIEEVIKALP